MITALCESISYESCGVFPLLKIQYMIPQYCITPKLEQLRGQYWAGASSWKKGCRSNKHLFLSKQVRFSGKRNKTHWILIQSLYHWNCCWWSFNDFSLWSPSFSLFPVSPLINIEYLMVMQGWTIYGNFLNNWIRLARGVSKIWAWGTRWIRLVVKRPGILALDLMMSWCPSKQK